MARVHDIRKYLTKEEKDLIYKRWTEGVKPKDLALRFDLSVDYVRRLIRLKKLEAGEERKRRRR